MKKTKIIQQRKGFTLVELIVVITILAILGTISFIALQWHSKEARDTKRISDTRSLLNKINIENTKWLRFDELIKDTKPYSWQILWTPDKNFYSMWVVDFDVLKENPANFTDPSNDEQNYLFSYAKWWTWSWAYNFIQVATISEKENKTKLIWNYYTTKADDMPSLFLKEWWDSTKQEDFYQENWNPIYDPKTWTIWTPWWAPEIIPTYSCTNENWVILANANYNSDTSSLTENKEYIKWDTSVACGYECKSTYSWDLCDTREVFWDEDSEAISACNKWVEEAIWTTNWWWHTGWLWVPARPKQLETEPENIFTDDGTPWWTKLTDDYYKRTVTYNNINYTCKWFAVAKYEMSYDDDSLTANSSGWDWNTVAYTNAVANWWIVSKAGRFPIADINQGNTIAACKSIQIWTWTITPHLITNNEWMAIARNIEQQDSNWFTDTNKNRYLSNWLSGDELHWCGWTSTSIYWWRTRAAKTWAWNDSKWCDVKRQHQLSNWNIIWDLSGNVWEHVNKANTIDWSNYNNWMTEFDSTAGNWDWIFQWHKTWWNASTLDTVRPKYWPSNATYTHTINWVWNIHWKYTTTANNIFDRGGRARSGAHAGVFTLDLTWSTADQNRDVGFRCSL